MIGLNVSQAKTWFRPEAVLAAKDRREVAWLRKAGAYVRRSARESIRRRRQASAPGTPPSSHTGVLRRFIYFVVQPTKHSVLVGPAKTNQVFFDRHRQPVKGTVPSVLEYGGEVTILEYQIGGGWYRADLRSPRSWAGRPTRYRTVSIRARPYMRPALEREKPRLPRLWKDIIV